MWKSHPRAMRMKISDAVSMLWVLAQSFEGTVEIRMDGLYLMAGGAEIKVDGAGSVLTFESPAGKSVVSYPADMAKLRRKIRYKHINAAGIVEEAP
jgi:hypothetical protein